MSLEKVEQSYMLIPKIALDLDEKISIRYCKYSVYTEIALWNEFDNIIHNLSSEVFFQYDQTSFEFNFPLSSSVSSLFNSFFVNKLEYGKPLITNMNESRKLRIIISMKIFFLYAWYPQEAIIKTDILQAAYLY